MLYRHPLARARNGAQRRGYNVLLMICVPMWPSCLCAQVNTSFYPMLAARKTWLGCSTFAYALRPQSQRAFQSRHISTMFWGATAYLQDLRQAVALPVSGQDDLDRKSAATFANNSRRPRGRGRCLLGSADTQFAASSQGIALPFFYPIDRYHLGGCLV